MNRKSLYILTLCLIVGSTVVVTQSLGQSSTPNSPTLQGSTRPRIGVIDFVRIFNECDQIKDLNDMIRQKEEDLQTEAKQRRSIIENKQIELTAFQPSTADYRSRRKDLLRLNIEANVWLKTVEQDLETEKFDWTRIIYDNSLRIAEDVAKKQGFDIVLQYIDFKPQDIEPTVASIRRVIKDRTVIYNIPEIDVTDRVIRTLNSEYAAGGGKKQLTHRNKPATP